MASRNTPVGNRLADKTASFGNELADRATEAKDSMSDMVIRTGLRRFTRIKPMPERTIASLQENLEWMKQPTK